MEMHEKQGDHILESPMVGGGGAEGLPESWERSSEKKKRNKKRKGGWGLVGSGIIICTKPISF